MKLVKKTKKLLILFLLFISFNTSYALTQTEAGEIIAQFAINFFDNYASETIYSLTDWTNDSTSHRAYAYRGEKVSGMAKPSKNMTDKGMKPVSFTNKYGMDCVGFVSFCIHQSLKLGSNTTFSYFVTPQSGASNGFYKVTDGTRKPGDILATSGHVAVYIGNGEVIDSAAVGPDRAISRRAKASVYPSTYRISEQTAAKIDKNNTTVQFEGKGATDYSFSSSNSGNSNSENITILSGTVPEHWKSNCKDFSGYFSWTNVSYTGNSDDTTPNSMSPKVEIDFENSTVPQEILSGSSKDKFNWLFDGNGNMAYNTTEAAILKYIVTIDVPVINENGKETTKKLSVHKKVAGDIVKIFTEIKEGGFKIRDEDTGAFNWRQGEKIGKSGLYSMHCLGIAVDVNWNSNAYFVRGKLSAGKHWKPGVDEFSMPADGVAVTAFKKYGWKWGGDWKSSKDYMHFSLTGN